MMRRTISGVAACVLVMGVPLCIHGQTVIPIDDFEGETLDGWMPLDFTDGLPWGPGGYDIVEVGGNRELRMHHTGPIPVPAGTPLVPMYAIWNNSMDALFSNGLLRAQVRVDEPENAACLVMRGDLASGNFYSLCTVTLTGVDIGGQFHIDRFANGVGERLWLSEIDSNIAYQTDEEWTVELGAVGADISAKVWPVGAVEPVEPQFEMNDSSPLPPGQIALVSLVQSQDALVPGSADASFDNLEFRVPGPSTTLLAGDADQDLDFDQLDLAQVRAAAKYMTGQAATWGEGDWDGAPGGEPGNPPAGNGLFDQFDIIAAQRGAIYLAGTYAALQPNGQAGDGQTSVGYNAGSGEVWVDAPPRAQLTSINIDSAAHIFRGDAAQNLGGSFDNDKDNNLFKATFGSSFGSLSFGNVAQPGLDEDFLLDDLTVLGSLQGGGELGEVDLVYVPVPEPSALALSIIGLLVVVAASRRR